MSSSTRATNLYPPPPSFESQSDVSFNTNAPGRALSPDDIQKMKYKIDLG
jgi:hypothetical protein